MTHYIEKVQHLVEAVPDSAKVIATAAAPMASLFGLTVEEWSFVLSGVVALLFILEKLYRFYRWVRNEPEKCTPTE